MGFTDQLRRTTDPLHQRILQHPFVTGIGDGTLDEAAFKFYIRQDYIFLVQYSRVMALAVFRAPDLDSMSAFARLLHETLNTEMALHRGYCARFGITEAELEATQAAPTTQAYTDFLVRTAYHGSFGELACALLPCMWGYCEIGLTLAERGKPTSQPLYAEWIDMYSAPEFTALAGWLRGLVGQLAQDASADERARMEAAYVTSTRYEYAFWDMAYRLEQWPV